jgi:amino acid permease
MDKVSVISETYETYEMSTPDLQVEEGVPAKKKYGPTDLRRALSERHVNMIAFSSTVGIGCFLQSGKIINQIGPGGALM